MTSADTLLTFNAGSSSIKIGLFAFGEDGPLLEARAVVDFRRSPPGFRITTGSETSETTLLAAADDELTAVMAETFGRLGNHADLARIRAVGHRVVHGGDAFVGPARLDEAAIGRIEALTRLAPLHQPQALRLIHAIRRLRPELTQFASFDTAFHRGHADVVRRFAIPRALHDQGIKRYGFHGLSYQFIAEELARRAPGIAQGKVIVAHLGSGASLCGLEGGVSRDTSMGFSALDGIPMATRCGALDPGVLLHLLADEGRSVAQLEALLYRECGLLGVSGISADSRDLLKSDRPEARQALDLFTFRIAGEMARIAATLGGLDAIVFTAGIGENQPWVRAEICRRLAWLGVELDQAANAGNAPVIGGQAKGPAVMVIPTDEEKVIADEAFRLLKG